VCVSIVPLEYNTPALLLNIANNAVALAGQGTDQ